MQSFARFAEACLLEGDGGEALGLYWKTCVLLSFYFLLERRGTFRHREMPLLHAARREENEGSQAAPRRHIRETLKRVEYHLEEGRLEEAEALLATYRRRQQEAEREAETIVASAKGEAERLAAEAEAKIEEFIARHTKMAENKIAQAEAQALADVRSAAADVAVAAAETILSRSVKDKLADDLLAKGIADFRDKLN